VKRKVTPFERIVEVGKLEPDNAIEVPGAPAAGIVLPANVTFTCEPAVTVNPLARVSVSVGEPVTVVLTVTVRAPGAAAAEIARLATANPGPCTVTTPAAPAAAPPTEMPAPKLILVKPCCQLVRLPDTATVRVAPAAEWSGKGGSIVGPAATVRLAVLLSPFSVAVIGTIVDEPTGFVLMVNEGETVCPGSMVIFGGARVAIPFPLASATTVPVAGAGELIVTLFPVDGRPPATFAGDSVSAVIRIGFTVSVAVFCATYAAVIVTGVSLDTGNV
jgi:hypothetical protein